LTDATVRSSRLIIDPTGGTYVDDGASQLQIADTAGTAYLYYYADGTTGSNFSGIGYFAWIGIDGQFTGDVGTGFDMYAGYGFSNPVGNGTRGGYINYQTGGGGTGTKASGTVTGGNGGFVTNYSGAGGLATSTSGTATGGTGGSIANQASGGGSGNNSSGTAKGGNGGSYYQTSGVGGQANPTGTAIGTGGNAGAITNTGANGGNVSSTASGNATGGIGGSISNNSGKGGNASGSSGNNTGGSGGFGANNAGDGGNATGGAVARGGPGGSSTFIAGNGGSATGGASNINGNGGNIIFQPGQVGVSGTGGTPGSLLLEDNLTNKVIEITQTSKLGFYGATPVSQINGSTDVLAGLVLQGLRAASNNPSLDIGTGTIAAGVINSSATKSTVNCSGSGSVVYSQPLQGQSYKKVVIYCNAALGTASYTFPTAFTNTPVILTTSGLAAALVTTLNTTTVIVTGATSTGFLFLEGY
jgi:hypothetical protein